MKCLGFILRTIKVFTTIHFKVIFVTLLEVTYKNTNQRSGPHAIKSLIKIRECPTQIPKVY